MTRPEPGQPGISTVKIGDRVRLTAPVIDPYPPPGLPAGLEGTVTWIGEGGYQISVDWDNGRRLMLLPGDQYNVITEGKVT